MVNLHLGIRYKKKYILLDSIIPGPDIVESFLFPSLHHVSALAHLDGGGMPVWDTYRDTKYISCLFVAFVTADCPGMIYLNGLVDHVGKSGCRLWCGMPGHHQPNSRCYYPALLKSHNFSVNGCDHEDVNPQQVANASVNASTYTEKLAEVCSAPNQTQYEIQ